MLLCVNDEVAEAAVIEAAIQYPLCNNDEIYVVCHEWLNVPVSRRQVSLVMKKLKKGTSDAVIRTGIPRY